MEMNFEQRSNPGARIGCRTPDDLSLLTLKNSEASAFFHPPGTTFSQDYKTIAGNAVELLKKCYRRESLC